MATFGYTSVPSYGFISSGTNNIGAFYAGAFPSPGGYVNQLSVYAATYTGSGTGYLCIWDASGNLLFSTSVAVTTTLGWLNSATGLSYYVPSGTGIFIGLMTPTANGIYVEYAAVSGDKWDLGSNATVPGAITSSTSETGEAMGAYVTYTPLAVPTISSTSPNPVAPTQTVTITGTGFQYATGVTIGGVAASSFSIASDTSMTAVLAATTPGGSQTLAITNPAGTGNYTITVGGIAHINTGTPASPTWTTGVVYINTGTPASPVWTVAAGVQVNTGTPASPTWTDGG